MMKNKRKVDAQMKVTTTRTATTTARRANKRRCPGKSKTSVENQHVDNANNIEVSCEMAMETTREHTEDLEEGEMERDSTSQNANKTEAERDKDKIG
jgi:hypothetical protein